MLVLGYDPGMSLAETCEMICADGIYHRIDANIDRPDMVEAVVIERPVAQGQQVKQKPLYDTCITVGYIAGLWTNKPVYLVPRAVIMQQLGYTTKQGNGDAWLLGYFRNVLKFPCGRGTVLNSSHARAALAAAQFNWRDPRNQIYRYEP